MMQTNSTESEYIKIHETEKSGCTLQITKKRAELLRQVLKSQKETIEFSPDFIIPVKDIRFIKASASAEEIEFPQLSTVLKKIMGLKERITEEISKAFAQFLRTLEEEWYDKIEILIKWVIRLDVLQSKTYVARTYNYCKPRIDTSGEQSFFDMKGLRHVLIEHIQQNELYVTLFLTLFLTTSFSKSTISMSISISCSKSFFLYFVALLQKTGDDNEAIELKEDKDDKEDKDAKLNVGLYSR